MKIAVLQPYFFPYFGYFQLINCVDKFIFYDDVNFIKKGWINRNRILLNNKDHLITISLKSASQNKLINEIELSGNNNRLIKTIEHAYSKAPYFYDVMSLLLKVLDPNEEIKKISRLAELSVMLVSDYLGIKTTFEKSSEVYGLTRILGRTERLISICKMNNADTYINPIGGSTIYNKDEFLRSGLTLCFLKSRLPQYPQFSGSFVSSLSIIDVLMFNSKQNIIYDLDDYELI